MSSGREWPIAVAAILGLTVAGNLVVMRLANDDPSFAIEPDYYRKAVHYDETMAREAESLRLGWGATVQLDRFGASSPARIAVALRDAQQVPLAGAQVAVTARFNARANDTLTAVLREGAPGRYEGTLSIRTPGEWEVRVDAARGSDHYRTTARVIASGGS